MSKPIVSLCIPTKNESQRLKNTITSIIAEKCFVNGELELVISDNCSDDDTEAVCREYAENYENIVYNRNETDIKDRNFPKVMRCGNGLYRKLSNTSNCFCNGSLDLLVELIKSCTDERPVILTNQELGKAEPEVEVFTCMDDILRKISYYVTWIGEFGLWEDDIPYLDEMDDECDTCLWQVPAFLESFKRKGVCMILTYDWIRVQERDKSKIFDTFFEIFYINYTNHLKKYLRSGDLTEEGYEWLERDLLFNFMTPWMIRCQLDQNRIAKGEQDMIREKVFEAYKDKPYFNEYIEFYVAVLKKQTYDMMVELQKKLDDK